MVSLLSELDEARVAPEQAYERAPGRAARRSRVAPDPVRPLFEDDIPKTRAVARARADEKRRRRHRRRTKRSVLAVLLVMVLVTGYSIGDALMAPGNDPLGTKFVEWVRDHGGGGAVNQIERWWYSNHQPPKGGTPKGGIPKVAPPSAGKQAPRLKTPPITLPIVPAPVGTVVPNPLPGEGAWQPTGKLVGGIPVVYQTFVRPDAVHTSLLAGAIWMDQKRLRTELFNGIDVPGGGPWLHGAAVPPEEDASLVAAFNGGFRFDASRGGYFTEGREVRPLVPGRASFVIHTDGTSSIDQWGRESSLTPDVASVRQNLDLIVDGGAPVPGLLANDNYQWGATLGGEIFVWRSGVGIDANGNLIYVAGELDIVSLASVLARAGAVRAMELDINSGWVSAYVYEGTTPADIHGIKLLGAIQRAPNRYLETGTRDFFALFSR